MTDQKEEFWKSKLSALLHDPLTKAFDILGHDNLADKIKDFLDIPKDRGEEDHVASAMDRFPLPFEQNREKQIKVSWEETRLVHPFSGKELSGLKEKLFNDIEKAREILDNLKNKNNDYEKLYHAVWWNLPWLVDGAQFLPADTRVSNHSIVDHLDITAALKGCINNNGKVEASLIAVSIGPVQELIAQARKTKDLWAGSYLLSYLIYGAIEQIGLEYGFDSIIYPYLRGISFVKKTLEEKQIHLGGYYELPTMSSKVASLPNIFVAIVPSGEADDVIEKCKQTINERWQKLADDAKNEIMKKFRSKDVKEYFNVDVFSKQTEIFPSINATSYPLLSHDNAVDVVKEHFVNSGVEDYSNALKTIRNNGGYEVNPGAYYRYSYRILMSKLAAIKNIRYFPGFEDTDGVGIGDADDFGAGVKACVIFKEVDKEGNERRDLLGALNAVKRVMPDVLKLKTRYESTSHIALHNKANEKLKKAFENGTISEEEEAFRKLKNAYFAVLLMDGDRMGKWVRGDNAPKLEDLVHEKVKEAFESGDKLKEAWEKLVELKSIQPAYHKGLSRTLGIFSSLVEKVVEKYEGMLVYCGGDDVLALLPADRVLECANDLRKLYTGKDFELEDSKDGIKIKFEAKNGILWKNEKPIAPLMGEKASMSAGIAVVNHKFPLQVALQMAREAEKYAKDTLGRNAFALLVVRRSGQITRVGANWYLDNVPDVPKALLDLVNEMEDLKVSHRSLYKLLPVDLPLFENDIDKLVDYVLKRSVPKPKDEEKKKQLEEYKQRLKNLITAVNTMYKNLENKKNYHYQPHSLNAPIDLLLSVRLMKRGEEK